MKAFVCLVFVEGVANSCVDESVKETVNVHGRMRVATGHTVLICS